MPKRMIEQPESALVVTTYSEFEAMIGAFVNRKLELLAIVAHPGLCKSQCVRRATTTLPHLLVKGRKTALSLYMDLYEHRDEPVILDDTDDLMKQPLCREYVKNLTETDPIKYIAWGSNSRILDAAEIPRSFNTCSPVCLIMNFWDNHEPIFKALESRATLIWFEPPWDEVYRYMQDWFWDQEIYDYLYDRMEVLKQPDARLVVKAASWKEAGVKRLDWRRHIDNHCEDEAGMLLRDLLEDRSYRKNTTRCDKWMQATGKDRATFYRRMAEIKRSKPAEKPRRLKLKHNRRPAPMAEPVATVRFAAAVG